MCERERVCNVKAHAKCSHVRVSNIDRPVTADTVPPEDAVRHGSITLANAVLPQRIRSAIADTIQL